MIISAYSQETKRFGAINEETKEVIVPYKYSKVQVQPNGIVVQDDNFHNGCYSLSGELIYSPGSATKITNIVFLDNNMFLFAIPRKNKVALSTLDGNFVIPVDFESLLYFCGINFQAVEFSANTDIEKQLRTHLFFDAGAFIASRICVKRNNLWGVYDITTHTMLYECIYRNALHFKNMQIQLFDSPKP